MLKTLLQGDNTDRAMNLLAYVFRYEEQNPEFTKAIKEVMDKMGLGSVTKFVDIVTDVVDSSMIQTILKGVGFIGDHLRMKWIH